MHSLATATDPFADGKLLRAQLGFHAFYGVGANHDCPFLLGDPPLPRPRALGTRRLAAGRPARRCTARGDPDDPDLPNQNLGRPEPPPAGKAVAQ
jgi:hypothetical protein